MGGLLREREQVKFALIDAEKAYPVKLMCRILRVSRSGFYAWRRRPKSARAQNDDKLRVLVRESHVRGRRAYGSPRIHRDLKRQGHHVGRNRVIKLMREEKLVARVRRRYRVKSVAPNEQPLPANILDRKFAATAPNQKWVGDTTELITPSGKLYLAAIIDLYSRFAVGWAVSAMNNRHLIIKALDMALRRRCPEVGLLFHSDQGSTYASEDHQKILDQHGITLSMSRRGNCYDNAAMESWFSTVKTELGEHFDTASVAKEQLFDFIEVFYNQQRMHSAIGYAAPAEFERAAVA